MAPDGHPVKLALHILAVGLAECVLFGVVYGIVFLRQRGVARFLAPPKATNDSSTTLGSDGKSGWNDIEV